MVSIMNYLVNSVILFSLLFLLAYLYMTRKFNHWKKRGVLEITPRPFIGNFEDCLFAKRSAGQWLEDLYKWSAGSPYMGFYIFDRPALLARDPELIKNVLVRDFNYFQDRFANTSVHDSLAKNNLFLLKNPAWKILRPKISPVYTSRNLKKMFELMVEVGEDFDTHMDSMNLDGNGRNLELKEICAKFTTDVIGTTAFGIRVNSLNNPDAEFRKCGRNIFRPTLFRNIEVASIFFLPSIAQPFGFRFFSKQNSQFIRTTIWNELIKRERTGMKRNDLIDILVELRRSHHESSDERIFEFEGDNLVAQAAVFFAGGFETSSTILSFSLYELAMDLDIQSKLRNEIVKALKLTDGRITYDMVINLPYLSMVLAETMRKYPSLPFLERIADDNYKVPDSNLVIEKGTPVYIPLMGLHYDPQYFPDPYKFDPGRFSEENKRLRKPYVYMPFGEGPHMCIGMRMGLLQTKLGLIKLITKYEFSPCTKTPIPMELSPKGLFLTADGGVILNVRKFATE